MNNEGTAKIVVDVRASVKEMLKELAYRERSTMTKVVERLVTEEFERHK